MKKSYFLMINLLFIPLELLSQEWGSLKTQFRLYSMIEDNQEPLRDYEGMAAGGKILYQTPSFGNLKGSVGVYASHFVYDNVAANRLEPLAANKGSRYVAGLVDTVDVDNESVAGIGEAYLRYSNADMYFDVGRMKLDTPFINPQDGRMIPTFEEGIWSKMKIDSQWSVQGGFIERFWNRNTPRWKSVEESLGYGYEMGKSIDGVNGDYYQNTSSKGVFVGNVMWNTPNFKVDMWDYYVENIFNLAYMEFLASHEIDGIKMSYGLQGIAQREVGEGGNGEDEKALATSADRAKSYMAQGEKSRTYGAKIAVQNGASTLTFAYNQTTDDGRFLFPREWGKEPLYTFQKRERSDGSGDCNAWLVTFEHDFSSSGWDGLTMMAGYGEYDKSDPKMAQFNKYGTPSYAQWNIDLFYRFTGAFKGLRAEYLLARKVARGETYQEANYNYIFRKNGMNIHNFILNYDF